ncbi:unnamed protein product [Agarophyton chilense]
MERSVRPRPGLHNCLVATRACTPHASVALSALCSRDAHLVHIHIHAPPVDHPPAVVDHTPTVDDPPAAVDVGALPTCATRAASAHAAAEAHDDVWLTVTRHVITLSTPHGTFHCAQRVHFEPRAAAVCCSPDGSVVHFAVAGADGVWCSRLRLCDARFAPLRVLRPTVAHCMVCVAVAHRAVAAAHLDGRVAVWRHLYLDVDANANTDPDPDAVFVVHPPSPTAAGDRVTDLMLAPRSALLVAWWAGVIALYDARGRLVWLLPHPPPARPFALLKSGTFLACSPPFVVACHPTGALVWIHVNRRAFVVRHHPRATDVRGFCCASLHHLVLWDFQTGLHRLPCLSVPAFDASCRPIPDTTPHSHPAPLPPAPLPPARF